MEVSLMIRRKKTNIFVDVNESTTVLQLKKIIEGIVKKCPEDQRLFKDEQPLDDNKTLGDLGITSSTARAQDPATVGLAYRQEADGDFETLDVTAYSSPPELPDVMKPQADSSSHPQEQASS